MISIPPNIAENSSQNNHPQRRINVRNWPYLRGEIWFEKRPSVDINFYRFEQIQPQINTKKTPISFGGKLRRRQGSRTSCFLWVFHHEAKNICDTFDLYKGSYIIRALQKITISSITPPKASSVFTRHRSSLMALSLFWALLTIDSAPLGAQPSGRTGGAQFSQVTRLLNTTLPTVNVFDAQGKPLSTATLRGSYTVLVFGCLT